MGINLIMGAQTVAPAMTRTIIASLRKRKEDRGRPTDDPGYKETLHLMRQLLHYVSHNPLDDTQHLTTGWVPHPPSVLIEDVTVPIDFYPKAAKYIQKALGPANLRLVGETWWQWRKPGSVVRAEWVEMKADYLERKRNNDPGRKVMFYVHGGAYFIGGIGHGPQIQRHARKLKGRVFAPRYRLAPQFPFPCAIQDVVSAYLYLLTMQDPSTIVIAGDSAGGGLCAALLLVLRDCGLPLPAGCSLISPWVDLTHSFPSIVIPTEFDYVPAFGFHSKPSLSWPPPTTEELEALGWPKHSGDKEIYELEVDGKMVELKDQIQMYAPNLWLQCPLVSPILAASLGGLCPLQVIVGGGEVLRDEQIYLAHKAADPESYAPCERILTRNNCTEKDVRKYPPTDVQLLVFDDGPHAAPTLGHTRTAKYEYRSIAQFSAWALSQAQQTSIDLQDDASVSSFRMESEFAIGENQGRIGKSGDPLPPFVDHMIRQRVDRFGHLHPLKPASELRGCTHPATSVGIPTGAVLRGWTAHKKMLDEKFASSRQKVWRQRLANANLGYERFPDGEVPPACALAGRRVIGQPVEPEKSRGKIGKGLIGMLFGKFEQDAPTGEPTRPGEAVKQDRRKTVYFEPQDG